jgi:alpha-amylase/alpha-mannosidase (GH57 family)
MMDGDRYLCIHGHFYQPPRENPWLEAIEIEDSAYPYHDWNERVSAECYTPNSAARILDDDGLIVDIASNYRRMSFDAGPTLLAWMESKSPDTYRAIVSADQESAALRSGHGNALAQVYNHMIMPLAASRDKRTQITWGIGDFRHRFGRSPEGMWLAETAVDLETLDIMAAQGIAFTVLAPHQASHIRKGRTGRWSDVSGGRIDPTRAYRIRLPSTRSMAVFFYDGPISRAVAFESLLNRGEDFAHRLLGGFSDQRSWPQIMNIATDGETYGHHRKFADMALAHALRLVESWGEIRLTNYSEFLAAHPPEMEARIIENTSWSCAHGIERWRSDCGCNSGGHPGWNQAWRRPLRDALDWLRDELALITEGIGRTYLKNPWSARDDYIGVLLARSEKRIDAFLGSHALSSGVGARSAILKIMEIQRHAMLMYTSCGWFFDELSGLETVQIMRYAARAIQLAAEVGGTDLSGEFRKRLASAKSNLPDMGTGADIFTRWVEPGIVKLEKVAAHYGVRSVRRDYEETDRVYSYSVVREDYLKRSLGDHSLVVGRVRLVSDITLDEKTVSFCVVHLGGPIFNGGVRPFSGPDVYREMKEQVDSAFTTGNIPGLVRLMDGHFGMHTYSLADLFRDEQRTMLTLLLKGSLTSLDRTYRTVYEENRLLMEFVRSGNMPVPRAFLMVADHCLNAELRQALLADHDNREEVRSILGEMKKWGVAVDPGILEIESRRRLEGLLERFSHRLWDMKLLVEIANALETTRELPFDVNLWTVQNLYVEAARESWRDYSGRAKEGDGDARSWVDEFMRIGRLLGINTDAMPGVKD